MKFIEIRAFLIVHMIHMFDSCGFSIMHGPEPSKGCASKSIADL